MRVVVIDVVDDKLVELALVPDDGAVEEFASKGADPAFGERVRHGSAYRCGEDLHTFGSEDLVEGVDGGMVEAAQHGAGPVGGPQPVVSGREPEHGHQRDGVDEGGQPGAPRVGPRHQHDRRRQGQTEGPQMGPAPPGGPLVDLGEPMMSHDNTVRSIGGRQDPNRGLHRKVRCPGGGAQ